MGLGPWKVLLTLALAATIIAVMFALVPTIGGSIEDQAPALGVSSSFNATHNTDMVEGGDFFADMQGYIVILAIALVAIIIIGYLVGMGKI